MSHKHNNYPEIVLQWWNPVNW